MAEVTMPQMGVSVAEGTITKWMKEPGDPVEADEPIVEVDTDKVETEVPAPAGGRLREVLVAVGETVEVGTVLGLIDVAGKEGAQPAETAAAESGDGAAQAGEPVTEDAAAETQAVRHAAEERPPAKPAGRPGEVRPADRGDGGAPPTTPVVRRMADEHDLDLSQVRGTGRRGRVTKRDVLAYMRDHEAAAGEPGEREAEEEPPLHMESPYREPAAAPDAEAPLAPAPEHAGPEAAPQPPAPAAETEAPPGPAPETAAQAPEAAAPAGTRELSVMRKRIAEHMVRSVHTAAHCTTVVEADMSRIEAVRGRRSYLPFVARATIAALREHPTLNATLDGDRLTVHEDVNLGIAVSLGEEGLIVPVVRNAHELSHEGLAARIKDLAERARGRRLSPDDVADGTFTITNPGAFGAVLATPIINQPQVAILDLEAVVKRPVVATDAQGRESIAIRPMTYLCMSWDHRVLDGALAARFLSTLKRRIEEWNG